LIAALVIGTSCALFAFQESPSIPTKVTSPKATAQIADANHKSPPEVSLPRNQNQTDKQTSGREDQSVTVRSIPPVTVHSHKDFADWVLVVSTFFLVVVGGFQILFLRWTVKATKDNANAALLSAQAVINSERPWLLLQIEGIKKPYLEPVENMPKQMSYCIVFIRNYGRTPAGSFVEKAEMQIGSSPTEPPTSTVYLNDVSRDNPYMFPPGEALPMEAILAPMGMIKQEDRDAIVASRKFLWLYGCVRYRDTFDREKAPQYETRFCLRYETRFNSPEPFWVMAGPAEYNKST